MIFTKRKKPQLGDRKNLCKFLLLPMAIGREVRWLEWVYVRYEYKEDWEFDGYGHIPYCYWEPIAFVDKYGRTI
jgi:hypothetical protein